LLFNVPQLGVSGAGALNLTTEIHQHDFDPDLYGGGSVRIKVRSIVKIKLLNRGGSEKAYLD
jgi:hypothetical protein